jgi:hypothetical protein
LLPSDGHLYSERQSVDVLRRQGKQLIADR